MPETWILITCRIWLGLRSVIFSYFRKDCFAAPMCANADLNVKLRLVAARPSHPSTVHVLPIRPILPVRPRPIPFHILSRMVPFVRSHLSASCPVTSLSSTSCHSFPRPSNAS